jgi:hypothetical protein
MAYRNDLTLDDFDVLMDDAAGKHGRKAKLTSYGPVNPLLDHKNFPLPTAYVPPAFPPAVVRSQPFAVPVPQPMGYFPDPMPRASAMVHAILFFTTGGIGNVIYQLRIVDKRNAWRDRHQY